ncbi:hypothetical protein ABZV65_19760 [Streptomyces bauhiniae]|uniref:hypothetical protein n=1 Tax=Streptomyces bauhiniae TaxID=2340725 RepID=UPI0033AC464A
MGLYHSVAIAYGFEIPNTTDLDQLDNVIGDGPDLVKDSVGHLLIGDYDQLLLVTRHLPIAPNAFMRLTPDALAKPAELAAWEEALHDVAVRLNYLDHPHTTKPRTTCGARRREGRGRCQDFDSGAIFATHSRVMPDQRAMSDGPMP